MQKLFKFSVSCFLKLILPCASVTMCSAGKKQIVHICGSTNSRGKARVWIFTHAAMDMLLTTCCVYCNSGMGYVVGYTGKGQSPSKQ